jgi:hypothetical protein
MKVNVIQELPMPEPATHPESESTPPTQKAAPLAPIFYPKTVAGIGATEKPASADTSVYMRYFLGL